ncbi:hypothetical protein [Paraburkholderia piptadeniae]|uniref:hypothetical protein n=1 Tax=Paraburkholderia piptadeniae TaxID=1701573 RepID=UPI001F38DE96
MAAFDNGRNRIRSVCAEAIDQYGGKGVLLHSGPVQSGRHGTRSRHHGIVRGACHRIHLCLGAGEAWRHSLQPLVNDGRRPHVAHRRSTLYDISRR